jgi:hypothetical protein
MAVPGCGACKDQEKILNFEGHYTKKPPRVNYLTLDGHFEFLVKDYGRGESGTVPTPLLGRGLSGTVPTPLLGRGLSGTVPTPLFGRGLSGTVPTPLAYEIAMFVIAIAMTVITSERNRFAVCDMAHSPGKSDGSEQQI